MSMTPSIDHHASDAYDPSPMTAIARKLDFKMKKWRPATAKQVERLVREIIQAADQDALDLGRSRQLEQEVLDLIDENQTR